MYDLSQRDDAIQELKDELEKMKRELQDAKTARKQASDSLSTAQKGTDAKKAKMVESLQRELQSLQQQMARKSAAAQKLLQEREKECAELQKANNALQQEVDKGTLSDRRIFELAAKQSNRESVAHAEIEIRDKLVERLTEALLDRDSELASAEHIVQRVEGQVEELCRVRRREDVNLDYLKSIVVQFLSKPPGSSERAALLPVLATLLQVRDKYCDSCIV
jgi:chromosome segregation ATPase